MSEYIGWLDEEWNTVLDQSQPVVRCRDCKYYNDIDAGCSYFVLAKNNLLHIHNPDGFCAWGERQEP